MLLFLIPLQVILEGFLLLLLFWGFRFLDRKFLLHFRPKLQALLASESLTM